MILPPSQRSPQTRRLRCLGLGGIALPPPPTFCSRTARDGTPHFTNTWYFTTASVETAAYVYCGQMAGWIRMRAEVELSPGDIMLDGDPAPHGKGPSSPTFQSVFTGLTVAHLNNC